MNALESAITEAIETCGERQKANKAYLEFIKANFIIPIEKTVDESVKVLFLQEEGDVFLPVFSSEPYLYAWAEAVKDQIQILRLSGIDLLKGIGENVHVALNIGSDIYKTFNPAEIGRMKGMILKLF